MRVFGLRTAEGVAVRGPAAQDFDPGAVGAVAFPQSALALLEDLGVICAAV